MSKDDGKKRKAKVYRDDETILRAANDPRHERLADVARALDLAPETISRRLARMGAKWDKEKKRFILAPGREIATTDYLKEQQLRANVGGYELMSPTTSQSTTEFANPPMPASPWKRREGQA